MFNGFPLHIQFRVENIPHNRIYRYLISEGYLAAYNLLVFDWAVAIKTNKELILCKTAANQQQNKNLKNYFRHFSAVSKSQIKFKPFLIMHNYFLHFFLSFLKLWKIKWKQTSKTLVLTRPNRSKSLNSIFNLHIGIFQYGIS